jgi:conjugative relaxase-like TrwC/TraI family protein
MVMISFAPVFAAGAASYFAGGQTRQPDDYYPEQRPGQWRGLGAAGLGLTGNVDPKAFTALLQGISPVDGSPLVQRQRHKDRQIHQAGWDLCVSEPKTLSALYAVAPSDLRKAIDSIRDEVLSRTVVSYVEELTFSRRGKGGHRLESANPVMASFTHSTSRDLDPQLHAHLIIAQVGVRADGSTGTILSRPYYVNQRTLNAIYLGELGYRLENDLGLQCKRVRSWWELEGVPNELATHWSKRSEAISKRVGGRENASAHAKQIAALETRVAKDRSVSAGDLLPRWRNEARVYGFTPAHVVSLLGRGRRFDHEQELKTAWEKTVTKLSATKSHFSERELLGELATETFGRGVPMECVRTALHQKLSHSPEIIRLGTWRGEVQYTLPAILRLEEKLVDLAVKSLGIKDHMLSQRVVENQLASTRLSAEQKDAVRLSTQKDQSISVITGLPGTGKTHTLASIRKLYERQGYIVVGAALAGKAARGLEQTAGFKRSVTVASLLRDLDAGVSQTMKHHAKQLLRAALGKHTYALDRTRLTPKSVLVLDEAGMIDTPTMVRLMEHVNRIGCKTIICGDPAQLQSLGVGAPLVALASHSRLGAACLATITRQKEQWKIESIMAIRRGEAEVALRSYAERGFLTVAADSQAAKQSLLQTWLKRGGGKDPKNHLIITSTHDAAERLNKLAQKARRGEGLFTGFRVRVGKHFLYLGTPHIRLSNGSKLYEKDRVLFTNTSSLGVSNGDLGTVLKIDPVYKRLTVKLDDRKKPVTIPYARYRKHLRLGWCIVSHQAQGISATHVYVLAGGSMQDREISFVQASRARGDTFWFADRHEAGKELLNLCRQFNQSRAKTNALDILAQNHQQRTIEELRKHHRLGH